MYHYRTSSFHVARLALALALAISAPAIAQTDTGAGAASSPPADSGAGAGVPDEQSPTGSLPPSDEGARQQPPAPNDSPMLDDGTKKDDAPPVPD
jgi:hypothetical protein